jgi:hypothetical protein
MQHFHSKKLGNSLQKFWQETILSQNWKVIGLLIILTIILSSPIYYQRITQPVDSDYGSHIRFTQEFLQTRQLEPATLSHPVMQFILAFMYWVTRSQLGLYASMIVVQVVVQILIVLILYFWIGKGVKNNWDWIRAVAALSLSFVGPIVIPAIWDQQFYYGYIGMANYHNPTIHLLKPIGLVSMMFAIRALDGKKSAWWVILFSALLLSFSAWIKPNYVIAVLPALGLACLIRLLQKQRMDWKMILLGFVLPGVVNLFFQWLIAYYYGDPEEGIILAPFQVESSFSDWLLLKFLLSALFPLLGLWIARKHLLKDSALLAGWTIFVVGVVQNYVLAEGGERLLHGNFRWSGQIALFLLFAILLRWLLREKILPNRTVLWEKISGFVVYAAHLAGGVAYYIYCMISIHYR